MKPMIGDTARDMADLHAECVAQERLLKALIATHPNLKELHTQWLAHDPTPIVSHGVPEARYLEAFARWQAVLDGTR